MKSTKLSAKIIILLALIFLLGCGSSSSSDSDSSSLDGIAEGVSSASEDTGTLSLSIAPYYEHNLELEDYKEMAQILAEIKAKFILSINDHFEMCKVFSDFNIKPVKLKYSVAKDQNTVGKELLISNL